MDTSRLRDRLIEVDYTTDSVLECVGDAGQAELHRDCTLPADITLAGTGGPLTALIRMLLLRQQVPSRVAEHAFGRCFLDVVAQRIIAMDGESARAVVELRPYASPDDGTSGWLVNGLTPGLGGVVEPTRPDYVLGASPVSLTLTEIAMRGHVGRTLDLGTGCRVQSYHLSRHANRVTAADLNPHTLRLARLGVTLSGMDVGFREGPLYEPVAGERFDLIISNPPYVMSPPGGQHLTYRGSTFTADDLVGAIVRGTPAYLTPGGSLQLLTNWTVTQELWEERLASRMDDSDCDPSVIERERLDQLAYVEMQPTDVDLAGRPEWEPTYRGWLAYFGRLGIDEVGMGWILLTSLGRKTPEIRCESWPHAVAQPIEDMFAVHAHTVNAVCLDAADLLVLVPRLTGMVAETTGRPGVADPKYLMLRQRTGLLHRMRLSTVAGAVLEALNGDLAVGQTMAVAAQLLKVPAEKVVAEAIPTVRRALTEQYLIAR